MDRHEVATTLLRGLHVAASLSLFGCLLFRCCVVPRDARELPLKTVDRIAFVSASFALAIGGVWLVAVAGTIAGANGFKSLLAAVPVVARHTSFGNFVGARLVLLAGVLVLLASHHPRARVAALLLSGAALASQPMLGHIGAAEGRAVLIPIEIAHLLAAGAWLGSLPALLLCVTRGPPSLAAQLCDRFTPVGLVAVGTIAVTALPQAGALIGGISGLFGTQYGHLALVKLALFLLALCLACLNRLVLTVRPGSEPARRTLIGSIAIEVVAVFSLVLAAGAMASSPPAVHVQPDWPFAWRPDLSVWDDQREAFALLLIAAACGLSLIGASLVARRFRLLASVAAVIAIVPFASALKLPLVPAYATSYAQSTTGFSVRSIARGGMLFGTWCADCHGPLAGTGGESDLTAPHIWGHLDGELFWRVTNGVQDPKGTAVMPGYGSILSDDDRWALIDFIHAWNWGRQAASSGHWSPPMAAPATPLICSDQDVDTIADLANHVVVIVAGTDRLPATPPDPEAPAPRDQSDTITVWLPRGTAGTPRTGECVAASRAAWAAWQVLAGVTADQFAGYRAIVDRQGWLRAWLSPEASPDQVLAAVRDAGNRPIAVRTQLAHHH